MTERLSKRHGVLAAGLLLGLSAGRVPPVEALGDSRRLPRRAPPLQHSTPSTIRRMAFGLPDELPPTPPPNDDEDNAKDTGSVADETLESLTEKLERSTKNTSPRPKKDNKAMQFLRKIGKVGGAANKSFVNAVGSDEGSTGRQPAAERRQDEMRKSKQAYVECARSGVIDDISEPFPMTSSGREWCGFSDRVMGGVSNGFLRREPDLNGRPANVLTGQVSLANNGGFIQMAADLALDPSSSSVDASEYDGIELDVLYRPQSDEGSNENNTFNVHLRTPGTYQQVSYRHTFSIEEPDTWETIRIPFSSFAGHNGGPDMPPLDTSQLRRIGIVAIGKEMSVFLGVGGVRFYTVI